MSRVWLPLDPCLTLLCRLHPRKPTLFFNERAQELANTIHSSLRGRTSLRR